MRSNPRLLITGASGQLGSYLLREAVQQGMTIVAWSGSRFGDQFGVPLVPVDVADAVAVGEAFRSARPTMIIHAGAVASVAACRSNLERAHQVNAQGTQTLVKLAKESRARVLLVSTDLVFDGEKGEYSEDYLPKPLSVYGETKRAAELAALDYSRNIVVRVSLLFGPSITRRPNFFDQQITLLRQNRPVRYFMDEWRTPLGLATAARALLQIVCSEHEGIVHLGGPERLSRSDMGQRLAEHLGVDASLVIPSTRDSIAASEPRPRDVSLDSSRWRQLFPAASRPTWVESLAEMKVV